MNRTAPHPWGIGLSRGESPFSCTNVSFSPASIDLDPMTLQFITNDKQHSSWSLLRKYQDHSGGIPDQLPFQISYPFNFSVSERQLSVQKVPELRDKFLHHTPECLVTSLVRCSSAEGFDNRVNAFQCC